MNGKIQSEVTYTVADFERHYLYLNNRNSLLKYLLLLVFLIVILIFIILLLLNPFKFLAVFSQPKNYLVFVFVFLILGFLWLIRRNKLGFFQKRNLAKQINSSPVLSKPQIITLDEEGFSGENEFGSGNLRWNAMIEVTETEEDFYFFRSPKFAQFVPKRFFTNEQIAQIRELAKRNLGDKAKV